MPWRPRPDQPGPGDADRALVDRARRGDTEAFGHLVRQYQHRVVNYARSIVWDAADAEDVAQDAFVRAYRGLGRFRSRSSFKTWLYQIVTNTARTHLARRRARREESAGDADSEMTMADRAADARDVEAATIDRDRLDRALATLPATLREAVVLRDLEGLEYAEIAAALDIPIGTVESRIFRGRARLRAVLQGTDRIGGERR